jgi:hypothetical protein
MVGVTTVTDSPDELIAGRFCLVTDEVVIASGQNLVRGSVIGKVTASNKFILSLSAAVDGSQTPVVILADDVDATGGDKRALVYRTGEFNEAALTFGTGHDADSVRAPLRDAGIHLKKITG